MTHASGSILETDALPIFCYQSAVLRHIRG
jgi:hypothetical protein